MPQHPSPRAKCYLDGDDQLVVYDPKNPAAWIQSSVTAPLDRWQ